MVVPRCTDPKTGYRYYSYDQICYISRVKYLQQFGFSLEEIRAALAANDTRRFRMFLRRRESLREEARRIGALLEGKILPTHCFVYLRRRPARRHPNLITVPAGPYLCVHARILSEPFDGAALRLYFRGYQTPGLVLANEYEDNFTSFRDCVYETQIHTPRGGDRKASERF